MDIKTIERAVSNLKTFGVTGKVFDRDQMAMGRDYITARHGRDAQEAHEQYFTALMSAMRDTAPTKEQIATVYREAYEEIAGSSGRHLYGDPGLIDRSKMHALAAARIEKINNFVWARPGFMSLWFEEQTLALDEQPFFLNETNNQTAVTMIGEDGTPERNRAVKPQSVTPVPLYLKSTKIERYKTLDLYRGNVADRIRVTLNLPRDLGIDMDLSFFQLLNLPMTQGGAFGPFSYENSNSNPALRLWNAHTSLDQTQLPTTNDYDLTQAPGSATNPSIIQLSALDPTIIYAIKDYCDRWSDIMDGGRLMFTGDIICPAADIINLAIKWLPVANANQQTIQKDLNEQGWTSFNFAGVNVRLIPSLFITRGTCYPTFNLKPGIAYMKPGFDREITEVNIIENWEQTQMRKMFGAALPAQRRWRAMRLKYSTASNSSSTDTYPVFPTTETIGGSQTVSEVSPYLT
jgi:hypothetical protein